MPFPPALARLLATMSLPPEDIERLRSLHYHDAGHGYDTFGMHPAHVAFGMGLVRPLYERYFRVESVGHEHIPAVGPGIIASNHSGNIPIDGMMLWYDVLAHSAPPRVARPIADHFVPALPWVGILFARGGVVGGSRGNARSLLQAGNLLMIFPEGTPGIIKPWDKRYQLQNFRVGHAEMAIRHAAPVIPVGVVGAEEQMPQLFASKRLGRPFGIDALPIPMVPVPLPVKYRIYYGEPIAVQDEYDPADADDPEIVNAVAERVKASVDGLLKRGLRERKGVFR